MISKQAIDIAAAAIQKLDAPRPVTRDHGSTEVGAAFTGAGGRRPSARIDDGIRTVGRLADLKFIGVRSDAVGTGIAKADIAGNASAGSDSAGGNRSGETIADVQRFIDDLNGMSADR